MDEELQMTKGPPGRAVPFRVCSPPSKNRIMYKVNDNITRSTCLNTCVTLHVHASICVASDIRSYEALIEQEKCVIDCFNMLVLELQARFILLTKSQEWQQTI